MTCIYCGQRLRQGEYVMPIHTYWTTEGEDGWHDAYRDGVKRVGWAHIYCVVDDA